MIRPPLRSRFPASRTECAFQIDRYLALEQRVVAVGNAREHHSADIVDEHVDAAVGSLGCIEHVGDGGRIADVGRQGPSAGCFDRSRQFLGRCGVGGIVDDDGETVGGKALCDRCANASLRAGDECYPAGAVDHFLLLRWLFAIARR